MSLSMKGFADSLYDEQPPSYASHNVAAAGETSTRAPYTTGFNTPSQPFEKDHSRYQPATSYDTGPGLNAPSQSFSRNPYGPGLNVAAPYSQRVPSPHYGSDMNEPQNSRRAPSPYQSPNPYTNVLNAPSPRLPRASPPYQPGDSFASGLNYPPQSFPRGSSQYQPADSFSPRSDEPYRSFGRTPSPAYQYETPYDADPSASLAAPTLSRIPSVNSSSQRAPFMPMVHRAKTGALEDGFISAPPHAYEVPHPFVSHNITEADWVRFLLDIENTARLSIGEKLIAGIGPFKHPLADLIIKHKKKAGVVGLIEAWNSQYFNPRRMEVILCKEEKRLSGQTDLPPPDLMANSFDPYAYRDDYSARGRSNSMSSTDSEYDPRAGPAQSQWSNSRDQVTGYQQQVPGDRRSSKQREKDVKREYKEQEKELEREMKNARGSEKRELRKEKHELKKEAKKAEREAKRDDRRDKRDGSREGKMAKSGNTAPIVRSGKSLKGFRLVIIPY